MFLPETHYRLTSQRSAWRPRLRSRWRKPIEIRRFSGRSADVAGLGESTDLKILKDIETNISNLHNNWAPRLYRTVGFDWRPNSDVAITNLRINPFGLFAARSSLRWYLSQYYSAASTDTAWRPLGVSVTCIEIRCPSNGQSPAGQVHRHVSRQAGRNGRRDPTL
jgi:hypothetical protein